MTLSPPLSSESVASIPQWAWWSCLLAVPAIVLLSVFLPAAPLVLLVGTILLIGFFSKPLWGILPGLALALYLPVPGMIATKAWLQPVVLWSLVGLIGTLGIIREQKRPSGLGVREIALAAAWIALLVIGVMWAPSFSYGASKALTFAIGLSVTAGLSYAYLGTREGLKTAWDGFIIFGAVLAALVVAQLISFGVGARFTPIGVNAVAFGRGVSLAIVCLLWSATNTSSKLIRVVSLVALPILLIALLLNASRGPILALGVAMLYLTWFAERRKWLLRSVVLLLVAAFVLLSFSIQMPKSEAMSSRMSGTGTQQDTSGIIRLFLWYGAAQDFLRHPVLGDGTGGFIAPGMTRPGFFPHNIFMETAAEHGLIGLSLLAALILLTLLTWRKFHRAAKESLLVSLGHFSTALILAAWINALLGSNLPGNMMIWVGTFSLAAVAKLAARKEDADLGAVAS